jgi:hypothetical protein
MFGENDGCRRRSNGEVELAARFAAAAGVVELAEVGGDLGEFEAGFFLYFTGQGGVEAFSGVDLAAGELPEAAHEVVGGALEKEDAALVVSDDCADDELGDAVLGGFGGEFVEQLVIHVGLLS